LQQIWGGPDEHSASTTQDAEFIDARFSPELRPLLDEAFEIYGSKSEYVVAAPPCLAASFKAKGWKKANRPFERLHRLLRYVASAATRRRLGLASPRWFHSLRASRITEIQREFPQPMVCSWLGNSMHIAQQSYLLVAAKILPERRAQRR